jgi:hypothetical protein
LDAKSVVIQATLEVAMKLVRQLLVLGGLGLTLLSGHPAAAQTTTPTDNPFHVVSGTTRSEGFTIQNTTTETIRLSSLAASFPAQFSLSVGLDFAGTVLLTPGESRTLPDFLRFSATGAPGTTGVVTYQLGFRGQTTLTEYLAPQGSITLITDAPNTVPEPSTAALLLPALGGFPLLKLRRRKRPTATA